MRCNAAIEEMCADLSENKITMHIPVAIAEAFINTDAVGFQQEQLLGNERKLFLLFEKDFKCIDGEVLEDQSDNFENPLAACKQ